jgi:hypothetical protein
MLNLLLLTIFFCNTKFRLTHILLNVFANSFGTVLDIISTKQSICMPKLIQYEDYFVIISFR